MKNEKVHKPRGGYTILFGAILVLLWILGIFQVQEAGLQDSLYQHTGVTNPNIFIVGIDEETLEALGPFASWDRGVVAQLIETLNADEQAKPAVIGVDIVFSGDSAESDNALVQAAKEGGNVVMASQASGYTYKQTADAVVGGFTKYEGPYDRLGQVTGEGFVNISPDEDGIIRHSTHRLMAEGEERFSFDWRIAQAYNGSVKAPPIDKNNRWYIPFQGGHTDYYGSAGQGTSFIRVLRGEVPPELFADSIVLVGVYATGMQDAYFTSISKQTAMYGVEIHANIIDALLAGDFKTALPDWSKLVYIIGFVTLIVALFISVSPKMAGLLLPVICLGYGGFAYGVYEYLGLILPLVFPLISIVVLFAVNLIERFAKEQIEKMKLREGLEKYLAPEVVKDIVKRGSGMLTTGVKKQDLAVLFVDIRGFTTLSERLEPSELAHILNQYFEIVTNAVFKNGGMIDKFMGDAVMALFNVPDALDDYEYKAVLTGIDIINQVKLLSEKLVTQNGIAIAAGVGINTGDAVVGNIGSQRRMDYTAIGDTVNIASRLETTAGKNQIILSQSVYEKLEGRITVESMGMLALKGKNDGVAAYCVELGGAN